MEFDAINAMESEWTKFFENHKNFTKDFKDNEDYDTTPCLRAFKLIADSNLPKANRINLVGAVVTALLEEWDDLAALKGIKAQFRGLRHPAKDILLLTKIDGEIDETLLKRALLLWEQIPIEENRHLLMHAFGKHSPIEFGELQILFHQDVQLYGATVLSIFLERGLVEQADFLFCVRMTELYGDVDPGCLDWLVAKGLPVAAATKWLEQSINRKNADAGDKVALEHCNNAIARWPKLFPTETM